MPLIDIQVMEGVFSREEKARIIADVTDAFGKTSGETIRQATSVRIHEIASGSWGYDGTAIGTEDALAMRARG